MKAIRKVQFCSGHRVLNHESKCANAHGHNYVAWITAESSSLDVIGRVIDFSEIKNRVGRWIDENWDHTFLIYDQDDDMIRASRYMSVNKPVYLCDFNPTAENMAKELCDVICPKLMEGTGIKITKIELYETENCKVEYEAIRD